MEPGCSRFKSQGGLPKKGASPLADILGGSIISLLWEFKASYHISEIMLFAIYPPSGNLNQAIYSKVSFWGPCGISGSSDHRGPTRKQVLLERSHNV